MTDHRAASTRDGAPLGPTAVAGQVVESEIRPASPIRRSVTHTRPGAVTLPAAMSRYLGLEPGDVVVIRAGHTKVDGALVESVTFTRKRR